MNTPQPHRRIVTVDDEDTARRCARGRVVVIDDDADLLGALTDLFLLEGYACESYATALDYLKVLSHNRPRFPGPCCVLCDVRMPVLDGLELQHRLASLGDTPMLLMSGASGAQEASSAFRHGAVDFLVKPVPPEQLLAAVDKALALSVQRQAATQRQATLQAAVATLTDKERFVGRLVLSGETNEAIAKTLCMSVRTVKRHRQTAFEKLGAKNTAEFVLLAYQCGL